jgi:AmmeMemoRadiSam system protein B/AmmeMemoRadiSam system protein A
MLSRGAVILVGLVAALGGCPSTTRQPERSAAEAGSTEATGPRQASRPEPRRFEHVFPAQVAGEGNEGFYTSDAAALRRELQGYLAGLEPSAEVRDRDLFGLVSPHAGYQFSGPTAARAYAQLQGRRYSTVVVMALSHHRAAPRVSLLDRDAYATPLGEVPIDTALVRRLVEAAPDAIEVNEAPFRGEHSMEIQIPFLQLALGDGFQVVPIILASDDAARSRQLARALFDTIGHRRDVLVVASSDLTHFYPYDEAARRDRDILGLVTSLDVAEWERRGPGGQEMPCGFFPILTLMELARLYDEPARRVTLLQYQNSGDTAGDRNRVVGYGAVAFTLDPSVRTEEAPPPPPAASSGPSPVDRFSREDRQALMDIAHRAVETAVAGRATTPAPSVDSRVLTDLGAAFVTLKCQTDGTGRCVGPGNDLRGCIGHIIASIPLRDCVAEVARDAAIHDRRFPRVTEAELRYLAYDVSVLSAPQVVNNISEIEVGRDGLIMTRGMQRGLLLPQVPVEWGWDRDEFLERTCHKAGMEPTCWRDARTMIERFGAVVWSEDLVASDRFQ